MWKKWQAAGLFIILPALSCPAAHLQCDVQTLLSVPSAGRRVTISTSRTRRTNGTWLVDSSPISAVANTNGNAYFSNLLAGTYTLTIQAVPAIAYTLEVPSTNALVLASACIVDSVPASETNLVFTAAASDLRYPSLFGSNVIVWTNDGRLAIAAAAATGGGGSGTNGVSYLEATNIAVGLDVLLSNATWAALWDLGTNATNYAQSLTNGFADARLTNGLAGANVTNGLATTAYAQGLTNGFTDARVTNGLAGANVTNGLATTAYAQGLTNGFADTRITNGLLAASGGVGSNLTINVGTYTGGLTLRNLPGASDLQIYSGNDLSDLDWYLDAPSYVVVNNLRATNFSLNNRWITNLITVVSGTNSLVTSYATNDGLAYVVNSTASGSGGSFNPTNATLYGNTGLNTNIETVGLSIFSTNGLAALRVGTPGATNVFRVLTNGDTYGTTFQSSQVQVQSSYIVFNNAAAYLDFLGNTPGMKVNTDGGSRLNWARSTATPNPTALRLSYINTTGPTNSYWQVGVSNSTWALGSWGSTSNTPLPLALMVGTNSAALTIDSNNVVHLGAETGPALYHGNGAPTVVANPGSTYANTNATAGTNAFWIRVGTNWVAFPSML